MKLKCFIFLIILFYFNLSFSFSHNPVRAKNGMVVSADPFASKVGCEILKKGGNAIDAAVATGFALAVTHPQAGNIGGGGFMVIRLANGESLTIDFREKAPAKAFRDMFLDKNGNYDPDKARIGYLASGVPGTVAGLIMAHKKYGKLKFEEVITPAINLAEKGFPLNYRLANYIEHTIAEFTNFPSSMKIFTNNGVPYKEGDNFIQKDLANTLKRILKDGEEGFYSGETAKLIVKEMQKGSGLITLEDLKNYRAVIRKPVVGTYRGYEVISMGSPSSGGILLIHLLNILEGFPIEEWGWNSSKTIHYCVEAMKRAYADRAEFLGDGDFVKFPLDRLLSKEYAQKRRKEINPDSATPSKNISFGKQDLHESNETTHYSVIDSSGNAVSVTYTLNGGFGNYVVVDGAGFLLNNEMDDFSSKPGSPNMFGLIGSYANAIEPNKRMLSSMTPTILVKDNKPVLVIGSPGGSTIITTVLQVIMNVIDHKMNIQEAVDAYRFHNQLFPDHINYERLGFSKDVIINLEKMGYKLNEQVQAPNEAMGIFIKWQTGLFYGAADSRGYGTAEGY
jgi:gamma-glutamyltranspeptidase / glutathione hydrolase